jgi:DNA polymerase-3 subunit delta'
MIFGHKKQKEFLEKAWHSGSIGHALIFIGPEEIGKKTIAFELFKGILCEKDFLKFGGCGKCLNCQRFDKTAHPDFLLIQGDKEITIGEIRKLKKFFSLKAAGRGFKGVLINNAHLMNAEASNALLKILEEPRGESLIILVSSKKERIFSTILSRVMPIEFSFLNIQELTKFATKYLTKYEKSYLMLANGRPGRLIKLSKNKQYLADLRFFKDAFNAALARKNFFNWDDFVALEEITFLEKLESLAEAINEKLFEAVVGKKDSTELKFLSDLASALLIRKRALAHYNLNERIAWESLAVYWQN